MEKNREALITLSRLLDLWLPFKTQWDHTPGVSAVLAYKGKVVYAKGFGYANLRKKKKTTVETRYRVASMSKMFTAVALMQLQEQKKLKITDPASKYLPFHRDASLTCGAKGSPLIFQRKGSIPALRIWNPSALLILRSLFGEPKSMLSIMKNTAIGSTPESWDFGILKDLPRSILIM